MTEHAPPGPGAPKRIGLLAGWGRYPLVVADALRRRGTAVFSLGVLGHADPALAEHSDAFAWVGLGQMGRALRFFRRHGVTDAVMVGKIHKVLLFRRWAWLRHLPDLQALKVVVPHFCTGRKDCKDDTLLNSVVEAFAEHGIRFGAPTDYAPELLVREGFLTRAVPSARQQQDIRFGWQIAKAMGGLDVGQSVAVKNQAVLAVEAVEGTDECIRRAGGLCPAGGFTVVKTAKPRQDMRFDVPTVGRRTLETMVAAGGKVLAIEGGRTILLDEADTLAFADAHGLAIVSLLGAELVGRQSA